MAQAENNTVGEDENSPCYRFEYEMSLLAADHELYFKRCSEWHFHLKGDFLLNVYPSTKTVYLQGSNGKMKYKSLEQLIELAFGQGRVEGVEKGKRFCLKKKRNAMWKSGLYSRCFICEKPFESYEETTIEHKVPLSQGGSNRRDNLALSHGDCNRRRGHNLSINQSLSHGYGV